MGGDETGKRAIPGGQVVVSKHEVKAIGVKPIGKDRAHGGQATLSRTHGQSEK